MRANTALHENRKFDNLLDAELGTAAEWLRNAKIIWGAFEKSSPKTCALVSEYGGIKELAKIIDHEIRSDLQAVDNYNREIAAKGLDAAPRTRLLSHVERRSRLLQNVAVALKRIENPEKGSSEGLKILEQVCKQDGLVSLVALLARVFKSEDTFFGGSALPAKSKASRSNGAAGAEARALGLVSGKGPELFLSCLGAVYQQHRSRIGEFLKKAAEYRGAPGNYSLLLLKLGQGSFDPFTVGETLRFDAKSDKDKPVVLSPGDAPVEGKVYSSIGSSGTASTGHEWRVYRENNEGVFVNVGAQGLWTFIESFGSEEVKRLFKRAERRRVTGGSRAEDDLIDSLNDIIEKMHGDLLDGAKTATAGSESSYLERNREAVFAVQRLLQELRGEAHGYLHHGRLLSEIPGGIEVAGDPGGQLIGRLLRRKELGVLPATVERAWAELRDNWNGLSVEKRRANIEILLLDDATSKSVHKRSFFATLEADRAEYLRYSSTEEGRAELEKLGVALVNLVVREVALEATLHNSGATTDEASAGQVFVQLDVLSDFRKKINGAEYCRFEADIQAGIKRLAPLFCSVETKDGRIERKWRSEPWTESVPEVLKKQALEAANVTAPIEIAHRQSPSTSPLLNNDELQVVKRMIFLDSLCSGNRERFVSSLSSVEFREFIERFVVITRKVRDFDKELEAKKIALPEGGIHIEGEVASSVSKATKLSGLTSRSLRPIEEIEGSYSIPYPEILKRARYAHSLYKHGVNDTYPRELANLERMLDAGLYDPKDTLLGRAFEAARHYVPRAEVGEGLEVWKLLKGSPAVYLPHLAHGPEREYFTTYEAEALRPLARVREFAVQEGIDKIEEIRATIKALDQYQYKYIIRGDFDAKTPIAVRMESVTENVFDTARRVVEITSDGSVTDRSSETEKPIKPKTPGGYIFEYRKPSALREQLEEIQAEMVKLGDDYANKVRFDRKWGEIFDEKNTAALAKAGFGPIASEVRRAGRSLLSSNFTYISRPLYEAVLNFEMPVMQPAPGTPIGRGSYIVWNDAGEPVHQIRARQGSEKLLPFAGESLIVMVTSDERRQRFVREFLAKEFRAGDVAVVAQNIVSFVDTGKVRDPLGRVLQLARSDMGAFKKWLAEKFPSA